VRVQLSVPRTANIHHPPHKNTLQPCRYSQCIIERERVFLQVSRLDHLTGGSIVEKRLTGDIDAVLRGGEVGRGMV